MGLLPKMRNKKHNIKFKFTIWDHANKIKQNGIIGSTM